MTRWQLFLIAVLAAAGPTVQAQDATQQLGALLQQKPTADDDPKAVKLKLKELINAAAKHSEQLAGKNTPRQEFAAISLMLQGMHLFIHRWPEDPDSVGFKTILSIKAEQLRQLKLGGDDARAEKDFADQAASVADYWLLALALDENNRAEATVAKRRETAVELLQGFLSKHTDGPLADAARASLKQLGVTPSPATTAAAKAAFKILPQVDTDDAGITVYTLQSDYQPTATKLRVLGPDSDKIDALLLLLPVEPNTGSQFGDPMAVAKAEGIHNKNNLLVVMPTFAQMPWYGDHPSKAGIRQESHLTQAVLPALDQLFPPDKGAKRRRLLLGFSKSGWGAVSLLVRHPALFESAAAWDAPLMVEDVDRYDMKDVFGTKAYFADEYYLPNLLRQQAPLLEKRKRLALLGHALFEDQMKRSHALLSELKIPHHHAATASTEHKWDAKWMNAAVSELIKMKP